MTQERLDKILIDRNLVSTRMEAEKTIKEIGVKVNGKLITKPGKKFDTECSIELIGQENEYLNINGLKLKKAVQEWNLNLRDTRVLEVGSGHGGCTQFLLQSGVKSIDCIDHAIELNDEILQQKNVRFHSLGFRALTKNILPDEFSACIIDIDSAPLKEVIPFVLGFVQPKGDFIFFFKPQLETTKKELNKMGVVKDQKLIPLLIHQFKQQATLNQLDFIAQFESPILGEAGNREYLFHFKKK